jgi:hypothetical protein
MTAYRLVSEVILIRILEALQHACRISSGIITETDEAVNEDENPGNNCSHDGDNEARNISWVVLLSEAKRSDEVSCPTD